VVLLFPIVQDWLVCNESLVADMSFQLSTRFRNNVDEKMRKLGYVGVGVNPVGQRLVDTITKTYVTVHAAFHALLFTGYWC